MALMRSRISGCRVRRGCCGGRARAGPNSMRPRYHATNAAVGDEAVRPPHRPGERVEARDPDAVAVGAQSYVNTRAAAYRSEEGEPACARCGPPRPRGAVQRRSAARCRHLRRRWTYTSSNMPSTELSLAVHHAHAPRQRQSSLAVAAAKWLHRCSIAGRDRPAACGDVAMRRGDILLRIRGGSRHSLGAPAWRDSFALSVGAIHAQPGNRMPPSVTAPPPLEEAAEPLSSP